MKGIEEGERKGRGQGERMVYGESNGQVTDDRGQRKDAILWVLLLLYMLLNSGHKLSSDSECSRAFVEMSVSADSAILSVRIVFIARCTLVQSAVLRSHVVCLSVRLSVCDVGGL